MAVTVSMGIPGLDEIGPERTCALSTPARPSAIGCCTPSYVSGFARGGVIYQRAARSLSTLVDGELTVIPRSGPPEEREAA